MPSPRIAINGQGPRGRQLVRDFVARTVAGESEQIPLRLCSVFDPDAHVDAQGWTRALVREGPYQSLPVSLRDGVLRVGPAKIELASSAAQLESNADCIVDLREPAARLRWRSGGVRTVAPGHVLALQGLLDELDGLWGVRWGLAEFALADADLAEETSLEGEPLEEFRRELLRVCPKAAGKFGISARRRPGYADRLDLCFTLATASTGLEAVLDALDARGRANDSWLELREGPLRPSQVPGSERLVVDVTASAGVGPLSLLNTHYEDICLQGARLIASCLEGPPR